MRIKVVVARNEHTPYAQYICDLMEVSARERGTGIAKRSTQYVAQKMNEGKAVVALDGTKVVGFSYIETWGHGRFVANSGLIVAPDYRKHGMALKIKKKTFELSRKKYPEAKIFGITTGLAVMKINSSLGYIPVTFSELTSSPEFWNGCKECRNYDILERNHFKMCLCTGMLYDPKHHQNIFQKWLDWAWMHIPRSYKIRYRWWKHKLKRKYQLSQ
ncbi:N-acetyltransferase [Bacteroidia bacterium]|nr:N-acetyltransferase [Bacteroidia bacterium]